MIGCGCREPLRLADSNAVAISSLQVEVLVFVRQMSTRESIDSLQP